MAKELRLAFLVVPSDRPEASRDFYSKLLGTDFVRSLWSVDGFNSSVAGVDVDIEKRHNPKETTAPYYTVDNLDDVLREATAGGAQVVFGPAEMRMPQRYASAIRQGSHPAHEVERVSELGRVAVILDPGGAPMGFVQFAQHVADTPVAEHQQRVLRRFPELGKFPELHAQGA